LRYELWKHGKLSGNFCYQAVEKLIPSIESDNYFIFLSCSMEDANKDFIRTNMPNKGILINCRWERGVS